MINVVDDGENNEDFVDSLMLCTLYVDDRTQIHDPHRNENETIVLHDVLNEENVNRSLGIRAHLPAAIFCLLIFLRIVCNASESSN